MSPVYAAKLREIQSVYSELKQLMKPEEIGPWLLTEVDEFENRTPVGLISKGETGRLRASLFCLRSECRIETLKLVFPLNWSIVLDNLSQVFTRHVYCLGKRSRWSERVLNGIPAQQI